MSVSIQDVCVSCSKIIKECHKNITCKNCKSYVHKKCTKLKPKQLKQINQSGWMCQNCSDNIDDLDNIDNGVNQLNTINVADIDFEKYNKMLFNPLRFENTIQNESIDNQRYHKCSYVTPVQFQSMESEYCDKFTILNANVRSLSKNFDRLRECIKTTNHDFTVIGLSETHLRDKPHDYFNLPGYKMEYINRSVKDKGGVCIYINNKVQYKLRNDLCKANSNYECCFIEIIRKNAKNILVGVIYRAFTPIDNFISDVDHIFNKINNENKITYLMGDFNIDLLKDDTDRQTHDYLNFIYSHSLIPTIYKPTRITSTTATIIDNILTNCDDVIKSSILVNDTSDHMPTALVSNLSLVNRSNSKKQVSYFKRFHNDNNISRFKEKLSNVNWNEILDNENADDDYNKFVEHFQCLYDECIPLKQCTNKSKVTPRSPWISKGLLNSINTKNKLYKHYLRSPTDSNHQKFKTFRNKLHSLIRKSKRNYYYTKFENVKNNIRQTWKAINHVIGRGQQTRLTDQYKRKSGTIITDPTIIANEFNDFFVNVGPTLASQIHNSGKNYYEYLNVPCPNSMFSKPIVESEILKIINAFDQNKSAGHDNIGNFIIKKVANEIVHPLTTIFNLSLLTGHVPNQLKLAKIVPIHKKEDPEIFSNYRPISLLPCFSKILERLVFNRSIDFINNNNILNPKQFGFRANHSTSMAIMQLVDKITNATEKKIKPLSVCISTYPRPLIQ